MDRPITSLDQISAEWLTRLLRGSSAIGQAEVMTLRFHDNPAFNSAIAHLEVTYAPGAPAHAPRRLLLKLNADHEGASEAGFYQLIVGLPERLPMLARCYAAEYDPDTGASLCLLQDYAPTHAPLITREQLLALAGVPSDLQLDQVVDALARFHAYWWEHPRLGSIPDLTEVRWWYRDRAHFERHIQRRAAEWARFIADVGAWFPADLRALYEDALARLPRLWDSYLARRVVSLTNITLSQGDCYLSQFLCPKETAPGEVYMIDFQDVSANFGAYDLVYMFATFWTPAQRRESGRENRLLRRYYAGLCANGVRDYRWDDLLTDYRLMLVFMLFDPIWNQTSGSEQSYWWPKLQCLTGAYRDLGCADLLCC